MIPDITFNITLNKSPPWGIILIEMALILLHFKGHRKIKQPNLNAIQTYELNQNKLDWHLLFQSQLRNNHCFSLCSKWECNMT